MKSAALALAFAAAVAARAHAASYTVDQVIGSGGVTGVIETDGALGVLGAADVVDWSLTLTGAGGSVYSLSKANSQLVVQGADLTATAGELVFDYDGADSGLLLFQDGLYGGQHYWCNATSAGACYQGASVVPESYNSASAQYEGRSGTRVLATAAGAAPEPGTWVLMAGGVALAGAALRGARRRAAFA